MKVVAFAFGIGLLAIAPAAGAHQAVSDRELILQVDDQGLVGLWRFTARGRQAAVVQATWDLDRDGQLGEAERVGAAAVLLGKLARSVTIAYAGAPLLPSGWQARLEVPAMVTPALVAIGLAELGSVGEGGVLRVSVPAGGPTIVVQVQALGAWRLRGDSVAADGQGLMQAVPLSPGEELVIQLGRAGPTGGR